MPTDDRDGHRLQEARRLGDLVNGPEHVNDALPQLLAILAATEDPAVTQAVIDALGHAWHPAASAAVLDNVPRTTPTPGIRLAMAQAFPGGVDEPRDLYDRMLDALTRLTQDKKPPVRDWAATGLGPLGSATSAVT